MGTVIKGEQLGRKMGFPTANIQPDEPYKLIPGDGVYLVEAAWEGEIKFVMLNIGKKPTVGDFPRGLEVNLFDFEGDLYGKQVEVRFLEWIREDRKYDSLDELITAIHGDKAACLELIKRNYG